MANNFRHLNDTNFPDLSNMNVYEYENDFDYNRWQPNTKIYLCRVLWNKDYLNVVKFDTNEERDKWFDNKYNNREVKDVELTTEFNVLPNQTIKVPIPAQVAIRYNYVYVDLPIMTSEEEPIDYETPERIQRYYYFIDNVVQSAPNTCILDISIDYWTTYVNDIEIPYVMLERGHAPMASVTVDEYLSNPLENNDLLLAPDVDYGNSPDVVRTSDFHPVNAGDKWIMLAMTCTIEQLYYLSFNLPSENNGTFTDPIFSDVNERWGYQFKVDGFDWHVGGFDWSDSFVQTTPFNGSVIPNNVSMFAISAEDAETFFSNIDKRTPFVFKTIKACIMVDSSMFDTGAKISLFNVDVYEVVEANTVTSGIELTKDMFDFPERYQNIAKLYTFPYSAIELTDNNGNKKTVKVENVSNMTMNVDAKIFYPYMNMQVFFTGIGGEGASEYEWKRLDGSIDKLKMHADNFSDYLFDWKIPTYALYANGYNMHLADTYANQQGARYDALVAYHNAVRSYNTDRENSVDSANNTYNMTYNSAETEYANAVNSADNTKTCNDRSANTAYNNAVDSATTARANSINTSTCNRDNLHHQADVYWNNAYNTQVNYNNATFAAEDAKSSNITEYANMKINSDTIATNDLVAGTTAIQNQQTAITGAADAAASVANGVGSGLGSGSALGMIGGTISGAGNAIATGVSTYASIAANTEISNLTQSVNSRKSNIAQSNNSQVYEATNDLTNESSFLSLNAENNAIYIHTIANAINGKSGLVHTNSNRTYNMEVENANRTYDTDTGNAKRTLNTSLANNQNTRDTSVENADKTRDTTESNADSQRDVTIANSTYTRWVNVKNAQDSLVQKQYDNQYYYKLHQLDAPIAIGETSGDAALDAWERRGIQVKIVTESDSAIAQAGDYMLRYGYSFNRTWDLKDGDFCLMPHFTYWKCSDVWINDGEGVNQDAQESIQSILENGVTVWNDPETVGKVGIYDNL